MTTAITPLPTLLRAKLKGRYLLLSLAVLLLDQWTKWMVGLHLPELGSHPVIPGLLSLTHVKNTGVAFGMFASAGRDGGTWLLVGLGCLALSLVLAYLWTVPGESVLLHVALALVIGGAIGNLIDRVAYGSVTDFIDFYFGTYHWHTFNVADSGITVGILLIAADTLFHREKPAPEPSQA